MKKHNFVFVCCFFFSLGGNILSFSLVYHLKDTFSFAPGQIGAFIALGQLFYFLGCNLYHRFGSAFNPVKVFSLSSAVTFLASVPLGHARAGFLVYGSYWLLQLGIGLYWPPVMAWLTSGLEGKSLNRKISVFNRSWMGSNIIGPLIAGPIYQWNATANFFIINASYFLVIPLLFLVRRKTGTGEEQTALSQEEAGGAAPAGSSAKSQSGARPRNLDKRLDLYRYRGYINGFSSGLLIGVMVNILPLHIRDGLGYTERVAGFALFMRCISGFIGFAILARFTFWHFNRRWFAILEGALAFSALLFLPAGNRIFFYFFIAFFYGMINSGCYTNSIFYSGATGKNPKKNMALHEIFLALGNASGTAGGGIVYQHFRFTGTCLALALVLGLALGALILINRREHPASASLPPAETPRGSVS